MDERLIGQLAKKIGEFSEAAEKVEKSFDEMAQRAFEITEIVMRARGAGEKEITQSRTNAEVKYAEKKAEALPLLKNLVRSMQELLADEIKKGDC